MIYIASPYSHPDPAVRERRYYQALDYAQSLMVADYTCFSPIVYGHQFATAFNFPGDHETWKKFNAHMLRTATEIHVLQIPGWEESKGIEWELKKNKSLFPANKEVYYIGGFDADN